MVGDFAIRLDGMEQPMATDVLQVLGVACNLLVYTWISSRLYICRKGKGYRKAM